jgi:AdoMet-dependent heme synthase
VRRALPPAAGASGTGGGTFAPAGAQRPLAASWVFFLVHTGRGTAQVAVSPTEHDDVCHFLYEASQHGFVVRTVEAPFFRRVVAARRAGAAPPRPLYRALSGEIGRRLGAPGRRPRAHTAATRDGKGIVFIAHDGAVFPARGVAAGLPVSG